MFGFSGRPDFNPDMSPVLPRPRMSRARQRKRVAFLFRIAIPIPVKIFFQLLFIHPIITFFNPPIRKLPVAFVNRGSFGIHRVMPHTMEIRHQKQCFRPFQFLPDFGFFSIQGFVIRDDIQAMILV